MHVGEARQLVSALSASLPPDQDLSRLTNMGVALRDQRRPSIVWSWRGPGDQVAIEVPKDFRRFPQVHEVSRSVPINYFTDRIARAFGRTPRSAWAGWPGSAVSVPDRDSAGTLGCFVRGHAGDVFALTCMHVLAGSGRSAPAGTKVLSYVPWRREVRRFIGTVQHLPIPTGTFDADCAFVRLSNPTHAINVVPRIGRLSTQVISLDGLPLGTHVCKCGMSSTFTSGTITGVCLEHVTRRDGTRIAPQGAIEITPDDWSFCASGDSGSAVCLYTSRKTDVPALGLLVAKATLLDRGYMVGLDDILPVRKLVIA